MFRSNFTQAEYEEVVRRTREYVFAGDIFQANLSQRLDLCYALPSLHLYDTLRTVNPSPFAGYLHFGDYELISSSPERLVSLDAEGWAETRPIAGTRPRGSLTPEDLTEELNLDPKDRAEHIMLVDLERNDLGRVCEYGTVRVNELMVNEFYSHVIHIVSNVRGHLHPSRDAVDLVKAMFPGGTITGCPKVRCMEIIDELETVRRGPVHRVVRLDRRAAARPQHHHPHAGAQGRPAVPAGRRRHRRRLGAGARVPRDPAQGRRHAARREREHRRTGGVTPSLM